MAKKTKQQRNAIRKEGWKQAAKGLKTMYIDSSRDVLANMGKGFTDGVNMAYNKQNRTTLPAANAVGAGLAGVGKAAVAAVKSIPQTAKTMAKGTWELIKGVFRGIFNHPYWYSYKNVLSEPAYNALRPFDPVATKSAAGSRKSAPGIGVCHVVKQNLTFHDMRESKSFQLAMIEAFKSIRLDLKSNLPYTQDTYNNFIAVAVSVLAKSKAIERVLGWYNVSRADIPELQEAVQSATINYNEIGKVTSNKIAMLDDANFAATLNAYRKLQTIVANIAVPKKLAEYISWWVASVFIDQSAPNPQLYINELRSCPIYGTDSNGEIAQIGTWDVLTGSIQDVIDEALMLLNEFGIMNADIIKTGKYGNIVIADVQPEMYHPITLADPEFFTILLNSYTCSRHDGLMETVFNTEYVRIDTLDSLSGPNLVGVTNALAKWAETVVPFTIESQCAYIVTDATLRSARNIEFTSVVSGTTYYDLGVNSSDNYWYQIHTVVDNDIEVQMLASSSSIVKTFTPDIKYAGSGLPTPTAATAQLGLLSFESLAMNNENFTTDLSFVQCADGTWINIQFTIASGTVNAVKLTTSTTRRVNTRNTGDTVLITLASGTDFTITTSTWGPGWTYNKIELKGSTVTVPAAARAKILSSLTVGSNFFYAGIINAATFTSTTTNKTVNAKGINSVAYLEFTDYVDYHLPLIFRENFRINDGTDGAVLIGVSTLIKQTYIPLLFNYSDVEAVLYWMYLGLFSIE